MLRARNHDQTELTMVQVKKRHPIKETIEEKCPEENGTASEALLPKKLTNVWLQPYMLFYQYIYHVDCYKSIF